MYFDSPMGPLVIEASPRGLTRLHFAGDAMLEGADIVPRSSLEEPSGDPAQDLARRGALQVLEYLDKKRRDFDLPLAPTGTAFQLAVWKALSAIPYGETRSYKDIAEAVGSPKASRAVGMANNKNPIAIVVPCHRVIGAGGALVGYASGLDHKRYLLDLEAGRLRLF